MLFYGVKFVVYGCLEIEIGDQHRRTNYIVGSAIIIYPLDEYNKSHIFT